jgi:hypothetical protein
MTGSLVEMVGTSIRGKIELNLTRGSSMEIDPS